MVFSSFEFLCVFLPACLVGFWIVSTRGNHTLCMLWLIACSIVFYAFWNPPYVALLLTSIGINFCVGKKLIEQTASRKIWLYSGLLWNGGLLGYYKYTNFFLENVAQLQGSSFTTLPILLPLGISFFTFQQIAFLVDVYKRKIQQIHCIEYLLFVSFFPQLIAGPIVHHEEIVQQFRNTAVFRLRSKTSAMGLTILVIGLAKKTIIADSLAPFTNSVFAAAEKGTVHFYETWGGTLAYTMQLYFDFSGYVDMAIGIALLFGIYLPINFYSPYKATSISDFWRRWHITLSSFLRDYMYIPLGGNRRGYMRTICNLFITMAIGGLWHGANWTFLIWGMLHGLFLVANHLWRKGSGVRLPSSIAWTLTMLLVVLSWSVFRAESMQGAITMLESMFLPNSVSPLPYIQDLQIWFAKDIAGIRFPNWGYGMTWLLIASSIALLAPNTSQLLAYNTDFPIKSTRWHWKPTTLFAVILALLTVISLTFLALYQKQEFLYFQF